MFLLTYILNKNCDIWQVSIGINSRLSEITVVGSDIGVNKLSFAYFLS